MRFISLLFFWLPFTMAANSTYTPCNPCIDEASPDQLAEMQLRLYTGKTIDDYISVKIGNVLELLNAMDNNKSTVIYVFGYVGFPRLAVTVEIVEAYLTRADHNVLLLDWDNISLLTLYDFAVRSAYSIGYTLAIALNELVAAGWNTSGMNLMGHSLGAQICGYAGKYANFTVPKITGLDPAGPGIPIWADPLTLNDAEFVQIIHTDIGGLGIDLTTGHVDFYLNGGKSPQPGCTIVLLVDDVCSHLVAVNYFAETVLNEDSFIGIACDSYEDFKAGSCSSNATEVMGFATPTTARGTYYLQTNSTSPYGKGEEGTTYEAESSNVVESIGNLLTIVFG